MKRSGLEYTRGFKGRELVGGSDASRHQRHRAAYQGNYFYNEVNKSSSRLPTPHTLHPTSYTPHPTPYTRSPYTLHPTPYTPHPTPFTPHPTPYTLHTTPYTPHPKPYTPHPTPYTLHHVGLPGSISAAGPRVTSRTAAPCHTHLGDAPSPTPCVGCRV